MAVVAALALLPASSRNSVPRPGILFRLALPPFGSAKPFGWSVPYPSFGSPRPIPLQDTAHYRSLRNFVHGHSHLGKDLLKQRRAYFTAAMDWNSDCTAIRMNPALMTPVLAAPLETQFERRRDENPRLWR